MSKDGLSGIYWQHSNDVAPQEHKLLIISGHSQRPVNLTQMLKLAMSTDIANALLGSDHLETYLENLTNKELFELARNHYALAERVMPLLESRPLVANELYDNALLYPVIASAVFSNPVMINRLSASQSVHIVATHNVLLLNDVVFKALCHKVSYDLLLDLGFAYPEHLKRIAKTLPVQNELAANSLSIRSKINAACRGNPDILLIVFATSLSAVLESEVITAEAEANVKVAEQVYSDLSIREKLSTSQLVRIGIAQTWFAQSLIEEFTFCKEVEENELIELAIRNEYVAKKILEDELLFNKIKSVSSIVTLAKHHAFIAKDMLEDNNVLLALPATGLLAISLSHYFFAEQILIREDLRNKLQCADITDLCKAHPVLFEKHKCLLSDYLSSIYSDFNANSEETLSRFSATLNMLTFINCLASEQLALSSESSSESSFDSTSLEDTDEAQTVSSLLPDSPRQGVVASISSRNG